MPKCLRIKSYLFEFIIVLYRKSIFNCKYPRKKKYEAKDEIVK